MKASTTLRADCRATSPERVIRNVLLIALPGGLPSTIGNEAERLDFAVARVDRIADLSLPTNAAHPEVVILSLDDVISDAMTTISAMRRHFPETAIACVGSAMSLGRVAEAVRGGASTVVALPTTFRQILAALRVPAGENPVPHMSLDRAIWEFLNQTVVEMGSFAGAARCLRIDRTSLKRMLRKVPML